MNLVRAIDKLEDGDGESPTFKDDVEPAFINSTSVQMTNGGTNYKGDLLLANSGRTERFPGTLALVNRQNPTNVTTFINNAFGKQFTAINDVVVHESGSIFFTDAIYGCEYLSRRCSKQSTCGSRGFADSRVLLLSTQTNKALDLHLIFLKALGDLNRFQDV